MSSYIQRWTYRERETHYSICATTVYYKYDIILYATFAHRTIGLRRYCCSRQLPREDFELVRINRHPVSFIGFSERNPSRRPRGALPRTAQLVLNENDSYFFLIKTIRYYCYHKLLLYFTHKRIPIRYR